MEMVSLPVWILVAVVIVLGFLGLGGIVGLVILALKLVAIVQKMTERPTEDRGGHYTLEQGHDVGQQQS